MDDIDGIDNLTRLRKLLNIQSSSNHSHHNTILARPAEPEYFAPHDEFSFPSSSIFVDPDESDCDEPPFVAPKIGVFNPAILRARPTFKKPIPGTWHRGDVGEYDEPRTRAPILGTSPADDESMHQTKIHKIGKNSAGAGVPTIRERVSRTNNVSCDQGNHDFQCISPQRLDDTHIVAVRDSRAPDLERQLELLGISLRVGNTDVDGVRKGLLMLRPFSPESSEGPGRDTMVSDAFNPADFAPNEKCPITIPEAFVAIESVLQKSGRNQIWVSGMGTNVLAVNDWIAQSLFELTFKAGDLIDVSIMTDLSQHKEWLFGTLVGKVGTRVWKLPRDLPCLKESTGFFPAKCVKLVKRQTVQLTVPGCVTNSESTHIVEAKAMDFSPDRKPVHDSEEHGEQDHLNSFLKADEIIPENESLDMDATDFQLQPFQEVPLWDVPMDASADVQELPNSLELVENTHSRPEEMPIKALRDFYEQLPAKVNAANDSANIKGHTVPKQQVRMTRKPSADEQDSEGLDKDCLVSDSTASCIVQTNMTVPTPPVIEIVLQNVPPPSSISNSGAVVPKRDLLPSFNEVGNGLSNEEPAASSDGNVVFDAAELETGHSQDATARCHDNSDHESPNNANHESECVVEYGLSNLMWSSDPLPESTQSESLDQNKFPADSKKVGKSSIVKYMKRLLGFSKKAK